MVKVKTFQTSHFYSFFGRKWACACVDECAEVVHCFRQYIVKQFPRIVSQDVQKSVNKKNPSENPRFRAKSVFHISPIIHICKYRSPWRRHFTNIPVESGQGSFRLLLSSYPSFFLRMKSFHDY